MRHLKPLLDARTSTLDSFHSAILTHEQATIRALQRAWLVIDGDLDDVGSRKGGPIKHNIREFNHGELGKINRCTIRTLDHPRTRVVEVRLRNNRRSVSFRKPARLVRRAICSHTAVRLLPRARTLIWIKRSIEGHPLHLKSVLCRFSRWDQDKIHWVPRRSLGLSVNGESSYLHSANNAIVEAT